MRKPRKHYTGDGKVAILRRHLLEQERVSEVCDELGAAADGVPPLERKEFFGP